jgi:hypothetical protein
MSWLFSRALAAEFSEATCLAGVPSAPLSVMPTQHKFWRNDKTMEHSKLSQFGLTCAVLTEDLGEALLTWFRADSPVRTYQLPGTESASMVLDRGFGGRWQELSVRYDLDSSTWKTHLCLWEEDLPWSSVILPKWGMTRAGGLWELQISALPTSVIESGLWQTPVADDSVSRPAGKWNSRNEPRLSAEAILWPTPTVRGNHNQPGASKNAGWGLSSAAKQWPTPTATLGSKGGRITPRKGREGGTVIEAVSARRWPTPVASASKGSSPAALKRKSGADRSNDRLDHAVMATDGGQLNPEWVEWLMGWPIGWTELKPLAMDRFREWQQQHSPSSQSTTNSAA